MFHSKTVRNLLLLSLLLLLLAATAVAVAGSELTHTEVAATDREYTYTTAEDVAAGRRAAERYWLMNHTIHALATADREFTYTTAEAVARGKAAAAAYERALAGK